MAHFAKLNSDNIVIHVSFVDNWNCVDSNSIEKEEIGIAYGYDNFIAEIPKISTIAEENKIEGDNDDDNNDGEQLDTAKLSKAGPHNSSENAGEPNCFATI